MVDIIKKAKENPFATSEPQKVVSGPDNIRVSGGGGGGGGGFNTTTTFAPDGSGVTVDGQFLTPGEYNAYLVNRGGKRRSGPLEFSDAANRLGTQKNAALDEYAFQRGVVKRAQEEQAVEDYKLKNKSPEQIQKEQALQALEPPQAMSPDTQPANLDALDVGTVVGGGAAGATAGAGIGAAIGSAVPGPGTAIGAVAGGIIGGIGGAASAYFYSASSERRQQVKVSNQKVKRADVNINKLFNDANSGKFSKNYLLEDYNYQWALLDQGVRELEAQQQKLFGEKLSRSRDELEYALNIRRTKPQKDIEFQFALSNPNGQVVYVQPYDEKDEQQTNN